ncbi:hypothetical protein GCM10011512_13050 [Tersicoccus solisilvae]|uniref:CobQ/CobB/MinD/ParA nucleotide binding domain-containing protein n=1 Tax=Tersicoccus solisilvae TaxID=1882339 RepID=A0ABQ1NYB9_9MICC|nr:chromosome partitioning protein [Tersicoccus solisilvae]GGC87498.1 hypothetical protein GCM10011512_13050 [Tersicoccus solisilvae]
MSVPLAILGDAPADHVAGLERLRGPVTVVRRCADLAELLAVCESGLAEVAVIAGPEDDLPGHLLDRLIAGGVPVLVLSADRERADRWAALGVVILPPAVGTEELAAAVLTAVAGGRPGPRPGRDGDLDGDADGQWSGGWSGDGSRPDAPASMDRRASDPAEGPEPGSGSTADAPASAGRTGRPARSGRDDADADTGGIGDVTGVPGAELGGGTGLRTAEEPGSGPDGDEPGLVIAVWGPTGAPGRSTIAVNLAAELAADLGTAYLVDADTYGSSTAVMLGLLDETAPVAQACRLADQGLLDPTALHRVAADVVVGGGRLRALTGVTRPDRWPELRPSALGAVLDLCRATAPATVIDCGFCLEADEELSFDTVAPRRNGATLRSLEAADVVIAVGAADAIGLPRLVKGLADLAEAVPTAAPVVAINRVRRETVGRGSRQQILGAWERYGPDLPIAALLPADPAADAALLGGTVLRESAPTSALRAGIRALAPATLARQPVEEPARWRWFRRGPAAGASTAAGGT